MLEPKPRVANQALNLAADPATARQSIVTIGMAGVALLALPDSLSGWKIAWLILSALLVAILLTNVPLAHRIDTPIESLPHIAIALGSGLVAVIISMAVRPISGMFLVIALITLATTIERRPFVTAALTVLAIPWWIWLAADEWRWQLLMLVPIIGFGLLAVSHILDTHAWPGDDERILTERAHRAAAWMAISATGVLIILVGWLSDMSRPWLALAGIVLALAIPLEAGFGTTSKGSAKPGLRIVSGAYFIAIACWLIGIA